MATSPVNPQTVKDDGTRASPPAAVPSQSPLPHDAPPASAAPATVPHPNRRWLAWGIGGVVALLLLIAALPWLRRTLTTVSTDDAYVNGHVTIVAPRVAGQVARVLVDDNNRVRKGDLLVELDKEPFQVDVAIAQAAVDAAQSDLVATQAQVRAQEGRTRSLRFGLEHAIEDVDNQVALLRSRVATLRSQKASAERAQSDFDRAKRLIATNAISREEYDLRKESLLVAEARVEEALEGVHQVRVGLGLPPEPGEGDDLVQVPKDLDQTFSTVKQAQAALMEAAAPLGVVESFNKSPRQMVADFYKRDPEGQIDRIYEQLLKDAPAIQQAQTKLEQMKRNLDQAKLNLRYCDVLAEIDGVVTRRDVNPGNHVSVGQGLMALRSLTEIWVDANFKETQLANLRIGQAVDLDVDMYGSRHEFKGRISGFTMGTGSTLALLPPENATGNFVKVVQRLPVRIDLVDYDPGKSPLFIGLSVVPHVRIKEAPSGPHAGEILQPPLSEMVGTGTSTEKP
jgi:membrane fusion protein, multidrug efflux system